MKISNDEAIKSLNTLRESINGVFDYNCRKQCTALNMAIKALEQTSWILVSEKLPEDFRDVLVWYKYFRYGNYNRMVETYGVGCYISKFGAWSGDPGTGTRSEVIAWMPLPEQYKAERSEKA